MLEGRKAIGAKKILPLNRFEKTSQSNIDSETSIKKLNNILFISYHFHPDLEVGAVRAVKFAKYLPQFGWRPHILSVNSNYYSLRDQAPLSFDLPIHRTIKFPTPDDMYRKVKQLLLSMRSKEHASSMASATEKSAAGDLRTVHISWLSRLSYSLSTTPDSHIGWYLPALISALKIVRRNRFSFIYSSGPPQTCHLVALSLSMLTGIPWAADFRDPWVFSESHYDMGLSISMQFDKRFERATVRRASLVLTNTDEWKDHLKQKYSPLLDKKCFTILNGFDEEDFPDTKPDNNRKDSHAITFLHAGTLYGGRDPSTLLTAAGELIAEGHFAAKEVAFHFYGSNDIDMTRLNAIISKNSLNDRVIFASSVDRAKYLDIIREADALVLFQSAAANVHIPAKAFEYLATGNRIIVLTSDGATKNLMSRFKQVSISEIDDKAGIKSALKNIMESFRSTSAPIQKNPMLDSMTKRRLTEKLAGHLDQIIKKDSTG